MGESTALLIRLCLESGATGMDAKLFLSFRPAEEAKHLEACYLFAERLGGYEPDPGDAMVAHLSNHPFAQMALDPDVPPEAFVAALGCLDDQLDLNLCVSHLAARAATRWRARSSASSRETSSGTCSSAGRSSAIVCRASPPSGGPRWRRPFATCSSA